MQWAKRRIQAVVATPIAVHSWQQLVKRLCRRFPTQVFRPGIEGRCHGGDLVGAVYAQGGAFREVRMRRLRPIDFLVATVRSGACRCSHEHVGESRTCSL